MQSRILKMSIVLWSLLLVTLISSCERKVDPRNQITITINSVDRQTGQMRVNMFDTIDVRVARPGFPVRRFVKVAEYITDSTGSVSVKLDKSEENHFTVHGKMILGFAEFLKGEPKDRQEVNVEVFSLEDR